MKTVPLNDTAAPWPASNLTDEATHHRRPAACQDPGALQRHLDDRRFMRPVLCRACGPKLTASRWPRPTATKETVAAG
jgi:hypothetical protein